MTRTLFSFFLVLYLMPARCQEISAVTDREKILIGEQFHLQITARFAPGTETWMKLDSLPHFEILQTEKADTLSSGGMTTISQVWKLTSWDSGRWQIKPFTIGRARSSALTIDVAFSPSPFDNTQPYHEIKSIIAVKKPVSSKWYWYLILLLVVVLLFLLFFPKEKKKPQPAFIPDEGAYRTALKKLERLEPSVSGDSRQFHTELVHIFREYLHRRRNIRSYSKTTDDLVIRLKELDWPPDRNQELLQALRLSDLVKFARFQPSVSENRQALETIRETITLIEEMPHVV